MVNKKWFEFEYENERKANEEKNIRDRGTKEEDGRGRESQRIIVEILKKNF